MLSDEAGVSAAVPRPRQPRQAPGTAQRLRMGGVAIDVCSEQYVLDLVRDRLRGAGKSLVVASANLDHVHHFGKGGQHEGLVEEAEASAHWLVLLDGMPLVWQARRMLPDADIPRLAGSDLLPGMLAMAERERCTVGFFGGLPEMHQALDAHLARTFPELRVGGYWAPARADLDDQARSRRHAAQIRDAGVELLIVSLGKPRQEQWITEYGHITNSRVSLLFGAAPDFIAGTVPRAPLAMRETGLEWLYRLAKEPRRMGPRYLKQAPVALYQLLDAR